MVVCVSENVQKQTTTYVYVRYNKDKAHQQTLSFLQGQMLQLIVFQMVFNRQKKGLLHEVHEHAATMLRIFSLRYMYEGVVCCRREGLAHE